MNNLQLVENLLLDKKSPNAVAVNKKLRSGSKLLHPLVKSLQPFSSAHYNPLCPINLFEVGSLKKLEGLKFILARDGAYTLLDFFHRFPIPSKITCLILVHESLLGFVPKAWKKKILSWAFCSEVHNKKNNTTAFLKGCIDQTSYSPKQIRKIITSLNKRNVKKIDIFLSSTPIYPWAKKTENLNFYKTLFRKFDGEVSQFSWRDVINKVSSYKESPYYDISPFNLNYSDDYTTHMLLSHGGMPWKTHKAKIDSQSIYAPISLKHGILVRGNNEIGEHLQMVNPMIKRLGKKSLLEESFMSYAREEFMDIIDVAKIYQLEIS